jgi:hypothetical protein
MPKLLLIFFTAAMMASCSSSDVYKGKDHPYRLLMRDMKPHYSTLEKFSKDAALKDKALEACIALEEIAMRGVDMEPGFLTPDQVEAHQKLFSEIAFAAKNYTEYIKSGQIKEAQGFHGFLAKMKKKGHSTYKDQAKEHRGPDPK